jgi:hypothetical protein
MPGLGGAKLDIGGNGSGGGQGATRVSAGTRCNRTIQVKAREKARQGFAKCRRQWSKCHKWSSNGTFGIGNYMYRQRRTT